MQYVVRGTEPSEVTEVGPPCIRVQPPQPSMGGARLD